MSALLLEKSQKIKKLFEDSRSPEGVYEKIISLGREMPKLSNEFCTPERLVEGCQSIMYLKWEFKDGKMYFTAFSEALISAGLAALLIQFYSEEPPETILATPPEFINELGIQASLTPGRSNGLASLYKKIKNAALLCYLLEKQKNQ